MNAARKSLFERSRMMASSHRITAFAVLVMLTVRGTASPAKLSPTVHVPRPRPVIDTRTLGPQTSTSYVVHDVGHPVGVPFSSTPIGFNNTGQIFGTFCQVYTGKAFLNVQTNAPFDSCSLDALSDADRSGGYAVVGYAAYSVHGVVSSPYSVGLSVALGRRSPAYELYRGYAPSAIVGVNDHGQTLFSTYDDPIGRTFEDGLGGTFAASTTDPGLALVQPDCQQSLAGCVNPNYMIAPFHSASLTDGGLVLGTGLNYVTTVARIGSLRSQAIVPNIPSGAYVFSIDDAGQIFYEAAYNLFVYTIASGTTRAVPSLAGCSNADGINITSTGSVLGVAFRCSNPKDEDGLFIYDAVHGSQPITQRIPQPPDLQSLIVLGLNDEGQLLFSGTSTATNQVDWGTLDPPGFSKTSMRARRP